LEGLVIKRLRTFLADHGAILDAVDNDSQSGPRSQSAVGLAPNINCLPSKNEIWSAKVADLVHHAANFGAMTGWLLAADLLQRQLAALVVKLAAVPIVTSMKRPLSPRGFQD
jgi:hypothetical protein